MVAEEFVERAPNNPSVQLWSGRFLSRAARAPAMVSEGDRRDTLIAQAGDALRKTVELDPRSAEGWLALVGYYASNRDFVKADDTIREAQLMLEEDGSRAALRPVLRVGRPRDGRRSALQTGPRRRSREGSARRGPADGSVLSGRVVPASRLGRQGDAADQRGPPGRRLRRAEARGRQRSLGAEHGRPPLREARRLPGPARRGAAAVVQRAGRRAAPGGSVADGRDPRPPARGGLAAEGRAAARRDLSEPTALAEVGTRPRQAVLRGRPVAQVPGADARRDRALPG